MEKSQKMAQTLLGMNIYHGLRLRGRVSSARWSIQRQQRRGQQPRLSKAFSAAVTCRGSSQLHVPCKELAASEKRGQNTQQNRHGAIAVQGTAVF